MSQMCHFDDARHRGNAYDSREDPGQMTLESFSIHRSQVPASSGE
jgi:hypothetical protein